jgi:predicted lipid-binding transport protein (Tim44 family)
MLRFLGRRRGSLMALTLAGVLALAPAIAEARMGGGGSFGSRGGRTWSAPPSTRTMPGAASPFERSVTPRTAPGYNGGYAGQPGYGGSSFGRGLMGGLAGGLLGAGLFGLLTGQGFFGGMGGFMSIIGLLMQIALIAFLARMAFAWFTNRNAPAGANRAGTPFGAAFGGGAPFGATGPQGGVGGFGGWNGARPARATPIKPEAQDFNAFERLLVEMQGAYSREDIGALRRLSTPEMASYFDDELEANRARGVLNRVSDVKLLSGDLAEAWREGGEEYATVAMRFALNDVMEDRATGRVLPGSPGRSEATEAWTFRREAGSGPEGWRLSAIQQQAGGAAQSRVA